MFKNNLLKLRKKMKENNIDLAVITDDDSLYYFTGYHILFIWNLVVRQFFLCQKMMKAH